MSDTANDHQTDRRGFLKLAGLGTVTGGAAVVTGGKVEAADVADTKSSGYRLTDHVKRVYETARF